LLTTETILIRFLLNDKEVSTDLKPATTLLDYIRYHKNLTGTKIGCREGDCGACTVLFGELMNDELQYRSVTSCLTPLGNANGKHVVTIEGLNFEKELNPIQKAMCEENGTQCGFCTPGFIVSFAGFCLSSKEPTYENAIASVDGNICRCTGYKSIERAAAKITGLLQGRNGEPAKFVAEQNVLPLYFTSINERLVPLQTKTNEVLEHKPSGKFVGGGTDLYVQQHDTIHHEEVNLLFGKNNEVVEKDGKCLIGASATVTDLANAKFLHDVFSNLSEHIKLVSSTPIRNIATIAGNFVNASPIGDFTIFFLALNANIVLSNGEQKRELPLREFYKGYKTLDKHQDEFIDQIWFQLPSLNTKFNFEKVSKRTNLDIASVNSAMSIKMNGNIIEDASISAGGVGPIPMYLKRTSEYLKGKILSEELVNEVGEFAQSEVSPISDARGTAEYKRLLVGQLIKAHFIQLFPELSLAKLLLINA
jgi:xanthine dehydrogenase small subunit